MCDSLTPEQLSARIEFLQRDQALLLSDFDRTPERIAQEIKTSQERLDGLPQLLNVEIGKAQQVWDDLVDSRDNKICFAELRHRILKDRAANGREIYRTQAEELDTLLQRRKALQNGNKLSRLEQMRAEIKLLEEELLK